MIRNDRDARLEASVVEGSGEVTDPTRSDGTLRDLLQLEKDVVIGLADRLGYVLSEAERAAILENGTRNLTAFLAYSRALDAEDRGDYQAAARYYRQAIQADPNFSQARDGLGATAMMADVQAAGPADAPVLAGEGGVGSAPAADAGNLLVNTINSTVADVASTTSEQTAGTLGGTTTGSTGNNGTGSTIAQPPPPSVVPPVTLIGTIRIIFRLP